MVSTVIGSEIVGWDNCGVGQLWASVRESAVCLLVGRVVSSFGAREGEFVFTSTRIT